MMEAVKGFVFDRGESEIDGKKVNSYLVSFVLVTDLPLTGLNPSETVIMGVNKFDNSFTDIINQLEKFKPPHCLGDANHAIMAVSHMNPNDLEPTGSRAIAAAKKSHARRVAQTRRRQAAMDGD